MLTPEDASSWVDAAEAYGGGPDFRKTSNLALIFRKHILCDRPSSESPRSNVPQHGMSKSRMTELELSGLPPPSARRMLAHADG